MHSAQLGRLAIAAAVGMTALWGASDAEARTTTPAIPSSQPCTVTLDMDTVPVQAEPVDVQASLSAALGDSISAAFPAESRITVLNVSQGQPNSMRLSLNTSSAEAGTYTITLRDAKGTACSGPVQVAAAAPSVPDIPPVPTTPPPTTPAPTTPPPTR